MHACSSEKLEQLRFNVEQEGATLRPAEAKFVQLCAMEKSPSEAESWHMACYNLQSPNCMFNLCATGTRMIGCSCTVRTVASRSQALFSTTSLNHNNIELQNQWQASARAGIAQSVMQHCHNYPRPKISTWNSKTLGEHTWGDPELQYWTICHRKNINRESETWRHIGILAEMCAIKSPSNLNLIFPNERT